MIKNKEMVPVKKREYYMSEVCSYYRLDELNIEKIDVKSNKMAIKLAKQGQSLHNFFEKIIDTSDHNLGVAFNGRLSPYSDLVEWTNKNRINVVIHERGRVDGLMNIRLNRKALDQQEFNFLVEEYMKNWEPNKYPKIKEEISREYLGKGNLTSNIWKSKDQDIVYESKNIRVNRSNPSVALFLSSTDEAYNDDGTLLLEMQIMLLKNLICLKKKDI